MTGSHTFFPDNEKCVDHYNLVKIQPYVALAVPGAFVLYGTWKLIQANRIPRTSVNPVKSRLKVCELLTILVLTVVELLKLWTWGSYRILGDVTPVQVGVAVFSWVVAFQLNVLDFRRFKVSTVLLRLYYPLQAVSSGSALYVHFICKVHAIALIPICSQCVGVAFLTFLAIRPAIQPVRGFDEWWGRQPTQAESKHRKGSRAVSSLRQSLVDVESEEDDDIPPPPKQGDAPLSVFVTSFVMEGSHKSFQSGWGFAAFVVFTVTVKWDSRTVWTVRRRFSDFLLLRNLLRARGCQFLDAEEALAQGDSCGRCFGYRRDYKVHRTYVATRMKGINVFLKEALDSGFVKADDAFKSFLCTRKTRLPDATFNTSLTIHDFHKIALVGKGSYGKVYQVRKKDNNKIFAVKELRKRDMKKDSQVVHTKTERSVLANISHPFICSLRYAFQSDTKLYMVLDFFNGGELFFHLNKGRFSEDRTRYYMAELTLALEHLHQNRVMYRDLKPENVLLDSEGHLKLTDFGLSKIYDEQNGEARAHTFCGTPQYLAPEVISNRGYSFAVDWWALGAMCYELLTRKPPFRNNSQKRLYELILEAPVDYPSHLSPTAISFIGGLLTKDPSKRLGCQGAAQVKNHPFFLGIDWKKLQARAVPVPFKPDTKDEADMNNVWDEFKEEIVGDSPGDTLSLGKEHALRNFSQFTYAPETYSDEHGLGMIGGDKSIQSIDFSRRN
mmetsp:Transcript_26913/g.53003  ORF Transcript_26913/g.53003 Transcript_26913/m.53003 type:complete len:725 (-) Transcript_26913:148-2322(-)